MNISQNLLDTDLHLIYAIRYTYDLNMEYKYVGLTSAYIKRFNKHLSKNNINKLKYNLDLYNWIKYHNYQITFDILEICNSHEELFLAEQKWISILLNKGYKLFNKTKGGDGIYRLNYKMTDETKYKLSQYKSKNHWAYGLKGSDHFNYGKKLTQEHKEKISQSNTGKVRSIEAKNNYSKAKSGIVFTEEHKANISKAKMGARKGIPKSDEQKQKTSNSLKGKTHSSLRKLNISFGIHTNRHFQKYETCKWCMGAIYEQEVEKLNE